VQGPFPRDDAGATPAVHAGRMNLINVGHGAVALRELADAVHRRDVARYADGDVGRVLPLAEELTRLPVDLIATQGTATRLLLKVSTTFPVVYVLGVGCSIHQQHTKKKDQIEHRKHEQATSRPPFLVIAPTYLP
jgi:hypothetical protein